jgi:hypothetical protein
MRVVVVDDVAVGAVAMDEVVALASTATVSASTARITAGEA